jgi:hypothetical protein
MKIVASTLVLFGLLQREDRAFAQIAGFVDQVFPQGKSLFCSPLLVVDSPGSNDLNWLFLGAPDGMTISLWNPAVGVFDRTSVYYVSNGVWSQDFMLYPGQGALAYTPSTFTNVFVGAALMPNTPPPVFSSGGTYLLGSKFAANWSSDPDSVFVWVLGRKPQEGEQFTWLDISSQSYRTTTFSSGAWDNGDPALSVGESAFFHLLPYPTLRFAVASPNVVLSWSASATNFVLETTSTCSASASWSLITNGVVNIGESFVVTNTMEKSCAFFRLRAK